MIEFNKPYHSGSIIDKVTRYAKVSNDNYNNSNYRKIDENHYNQINKTNDVKNANNDIKQNSKNDELSIKSKEYENLRDEEKKEIDNLKKIEQAVIAHEQAHISAGGGLVRGGASYSYQSGPDSKKYIVGGEVQIDVAPVPDNPQATIQKMQRVRQAALAPSDPSGQDRAVANAAAKNEALARIELTKKMLDNYSDINKSKSGIFSKLG